MNIAPKFRKSAGVPVTAAVKRLLVEADRARDAKDWAAAAAGYREALAADPALVHIQVQLGHALKEGGEYAESELAYRQAADLDPASAEPYLHLGHLKKRQGEMAAASRSYLRALQLAPTNPDALAELHTLATSATDIQTEDLLEILRPLMDSEIDARSVDNTLVGVAGRTQAALNDLLVVLKGEGHGIEPTHLGQLTAAATLVEEIRLKALDVAMQSANPASPAFVFDASDLISYFRNARLPTGIQRVQIETISSALSMLGERQVKICCFLERHDTWLEIPPATFLNLCRLSLSSGDRAALDWTMALARLLVTLNMAEPMVFPPGAFLINLGTSWWLQNYFLLVRQAKAQSGIRYVPFVHDLIPVMAGQYCTKELTQDFISWTIGAFQHADFFLVNSVATKRDLLAVADQLGHALPEDRIGVVPLDADFRKPATAAPAKDSLAIWGLHRKPFVLFVSTVEARKNHLGAFDAWIELVRRHGPGDVPKLVCVGNRGWLNDAVYDRLASSEVLQDHVIMLTGLSDAELASLYQKCMFTLYPSLYEGWGLPVTEALCYGKTPLISDASSLPEAGGAFATYFEAGSTPRMVEALEKLIFDRAYREERERRIAAEFQPRTWSAIAGQMGDFITTWAGMADDPDPAPPVAELGAYHPIERNFKTRIWQGMRSGEIFRAGDGWWGPDDWGCWTKPQGARMAIGLPAHAEPLRIFFRLHGLPEKTCGYEIEIEGQSYKGELRPGEFKWVPVELPMTDLPRSVLEVRFGGNAAENLSERTNGLDNRIISVGMSGFYVCAASDASARATFLEAVALGNIGDLAFNREHR